MTARMRTPVSLAVTTPLPPPVVDAAWPQRWRGELVISQEARLPYRKELHIGPILLAMSMNVTGPMLGATSEGPVIALDSVTADLTAAPKSRGMNVSCRSLVVRSKRVGPRRPMGIGAPLST